MTVFGSTCRVDAPCLASVILLLCVRVYRDTRGTTSRWWVFFSLPSSQQLPGATESVPCDYFAI